MSADWFDDEGQGSPVDVAALFDSGIPGIIADIVALGALVSMGTTSDGGALGVTVTLDGRWKRGYFRETDDATDWLLGAKAGVEHAMEAPAASSGRRKRSRRA